MELNVGDIIKTKSGHVAVFTFVSGAYYFLLWSDGFSSEGDETLIDRMFSEGTWEKVGSTDEVTTLLENLGWWEDT